MKKASRSDEGVQEEETKKRLMRRKRKEEERYEEGLYRTRLGERETRGGKVGLQRRGAGREKGGGAIERRDVTGAGAGRGGVRSCWLPWLGGGRREPSDSDWVHRAPGAYHLPKTRTACIGVNFLALDRSNLGPSGGQARGQRRRGARQQL
jgi:hypothetical protein